MVVTSVKAGYWISDGSEGENASTIDCASFNYLFCGFAGINPEKNELTPLSLGTTTFSDTVKSINPSAKTLLSIGGDPATLWIMVSNTESRRAFINSAINQAIRCRFDGLDFVWGSPPPSQNDVWNLGALVSELGKSAKERGLLLTAAVYLCTDPTIYPVDAMKTNLDWVNLLAFDFVTPMNHPYATAGPAALNDNPKVKRGRCAKAMVDSFLKAGFDAKMLVLGLPFFGYGWRLADKTVNTVGASANGPALLPERFRGDGTITYHTIMQLNGKHAFDPNVVTDYFVSEITWIGFDGPQSIENKLSYAKQETNLRGYVATSVGCDTEDAQLAKKAFQVWN